MKRIKRWVNDLSVKQKLIFYGYMTITPVLIAVCIVLIIHNYNKVLDEQLTSDLESVNTLSESVRVLQSDIKDFSTYICINNEIRALLTTNDVAAKNENAKLWLEEAPMQMIQDMLSIKGSIRTIAIYPENGVRAYLRCMDGSSYISNKKIVRNTDTYIEVQKSDNGMVWKSVPKGRGDTYAMNRTDKIVLYRKIVDLAHKNTLGYIVIGANQAQFTDLCQNVIQGKSESVLILDKNGGELCKVGNLDQKVEKYLKSEKFVEQNYSERKKNFTYGKYNISCRQLSSNDSIVCKIVPRYSLQTQIMDIVYMPIILLLGMLVGLMPLLLIISNIVTNPLQQVSIAIKKFSTGDFEQRVHVTTNDEVGEVARCFNKMVEDIKTLIDQNYVITLKEKESELAALQSQINPHFLYNTLDSLYWQATEAENDEIAESILALSQLFKLVLNRGKREVTVQDEVELVSRYLQIQKMRFSKKLNYTIYIEEQILEAKIPKLILQPFVENAIVHGFENTGSPCDLEIRGRLLEGKLHFEIKDTGIGMSQEQINAIWEEETDQYAKQRIGRYAIKNIRERLKLRYREDFEMKLLSDVGRGTTVILIIPFEEEERQCQ